MDSVSRIVSKSFFGNPTSKRSIEEQISREISSFRHTTTNSFKTGWLEYKIHAKKKFRCRRVKSGKCANIQNLKSRKFGVYSIRPDSKSCTFGTSDRIVMTLFLHGFYHQDDRVKTIFRSDYPRNISRGRFAPRERCKFLFLDSWSASQKLFRYEDILEPVAAHQIVSWVDFDHFWM